MLKKRPYSGASDLQAMIDLLASVRPAERINDFPSSVDLRKLFALHGVQAYAAVQGNTRLWFMAGDQLVAFAFVDH